MAKGQNGNECIYFIWENQYIYVFGDDNFYVLVVLGKS